MKALLLSFFILPAMAYSQVNYTVTVKRLKATADDCDGGGVIPFVCPNAPQDPVFNIWSNDAEANENHYCWVFEDDPDIEYNLWKDIQNVEIAAVNNVMTSYISFDMAGFESDALGSPTCDSQVGDDQVFDRQFVHQYDLSTIPENTPFTDIIDLQGVYYAEIEIWWLDLTSGLEEIAKSPFEVFPNPNDGIFSITNDHSLQEAEVYVYDIYGNLVYETSFTSEKLEISVDLPGGVYFLRLVQNGEAYSERIQIN